MEITITVRELFNKGIWEKYCSLTGVNEWAVKEGLLDKSEKVVVSENLAKKLGLI